MDLLEIFGGVSKPRDHFSSPVVPGKEKRWEIVMVSFFEFVLVGIKTKNDLVRSRVSRINDPNE